jgi:hypothetical protein
MFFTVFFILSVVDSQVTDRRKAIIEKFLYWSSFNPDITEEQDPPRDFNLRIRQIVNPQLVRAYNIEQQIVMARNAYSILPLKVQTFHPAFHTFQVEMVGAVGPPLELNEFYVLHGTSVDLAENIAVDNFRLGADGGVHGSGIYHSDRTGTVLNYATQHARPAIVISRVIMGGVGKVDDLGDCRIASADELNRVFCSSFYHSVTNQDDGFAVSAIVIPTISQINPQYIVELSAQNVQLLTSVVRGGVRPITLRQLEQNIHGGWIYAPVHNPVAPRQLAAPVAPHNPVVAPRAAMPPPPMNAAIVAANEPSFISNSAVLPVQAPIRSLSLTPSKIDGSKITSEVTVDDQTPYTPTDVRRTYTTKDVQPTYTAKDVQPTYTAKDVQPTYTAKVVQTTYTAKDDQPTYTTKTVDDRDN